MAGGKEEHFAILEALKIYFGTFAAFSTCSCFRMFSSKRWRKIEKDAWGLVKKAFKNQLKRPSYGLQRHKTELSQTVTS